MRPVSRDSRGRRWNRGAAGFDVQGEFAGNSLWRMAVATLWNVLTGRLYSRAEIRFPSPPESALRR